MTNLHESPAQWLADLFEFERCSDCGGDAEHHTAVPLAGNWFARCNCPPGPDGEPHPTVARFLAEQA